MPLCDLAERRLCAHQCVERALRRAGRCGGEVRRGVEPVERFGPNGARRRDGQDLSRQREYRCRYAGMASASAIDSLVSAVAKSIAP